MERHMRKRRSPNQPLWLRWLHNRNQSDTNEVGLTKEMISREKRLKLLRQDLILKVDPKRKPQMRWLEQWDIDSIYSENVDLANSQAALGIPLVDVAIGPGLHIALSMSYTSGDVSTNGVLGNGWNLHNAAQDFIVVDHKQSSFSRNHEYQLSVEGQLMKLLQSKDSDDQFTIENEPDVNVTYLKAQNRWIIDTPNMRTVYGASENPTVVPDALQWSLHWPNWRGPGTDEASLIPEVISWYMVSREEKNALKRKLYYKYITQNRSIVSTGQTFTSVIQLESVYDSEKKYILNLIYDTKDQQEYFVKVYKNNQGIIQFPIHLLKNLYLVGYHLETDGYQQQLQFDYEVELNGTRKLTGISQIFNENGGKMGEQEKIFDFKYQPFPGQKYLLSEIEIPTYHSSLHYSYESLQIPLLRFENEGLNTKRIPVVSNVQISQGEEFATLSYDLGNGGIYVEVYNKQFTLFVAQMTTKTGKSQLDEGDEEDPKKIKRFATLLFSNLVAVLEETGEEKRLHLFHRNTEKGKWPGSPSRTIGMATDAVFRYTDKLMVISRNEEGSRGKLMLIQPNMAEDDLEEDGDLGYKEYELVLSNGGNYRVDRLIVQDDVILAYNGWRLHGWRENPKEDGKWVETVISEVHSMEEEFFDVFEANKEYIGGIREQMNVTGLHMSDNMILLTVLDWNWGREEIKTNAHLILVNDQLENVVENVKQVGIEKVGEMEKVEEPFPGTNMTFRYEWNGDRKKFRVKLHDLRGEALEEMCKEQNDKEKCKKDVIKEYNEDNNFRDQIKEMMLFDFEKYFTFQLEPSGATTQNKKYEMTGNGWVDKEISGKGMIKLGTGFILETVENKTESETMYALYRQNVEDGGIKGGKLGEWKIHNQQSGMSVGYPSYVAMQPDVMYEPELVVLREEGQEIGRIRLGEQGEQILRMSNHETLFTLVNSTDPVFPSHDKKLIVRRVNGVVPSSPMWALVKTDVRYGKEMRVRGYENEFNQRDDKVAQENVVRVIPQNDKGYSGYYEEITVVPIEAPQNSTKSQNWYDVNGELVLTKDVEAAIEQEDGQDGQENEENEKWSKIWDFSGHLEISDISPYNVTNEEVAYFGFEPYENNTLPFEYQESSVIKEDISLTGTRMLRVRNGESFKGALTPDNQQATYVASAWVKFPRGGAPEFEFDGPLEYFKANLVTHTGHQLMGVYAQMKRQQRDWIFAEISLDLDKIRNNVYSEYYRYSDQGSNLPPPSTTNFTISLELSSENSKEDFWMDVDHVRFAPINLDWTVTVYNPRTGLETEQILGGGGILRKIYNQFSTEIGTVDESGQVEQFKSLSRSGFIFPRPTSDSQLGIQEYRREVVVIPEQGYHEKFDEFSFQNLWTVEGHSETGSWKTSKGRLTHLVDDTHQMTLNKAGNLFDPVSSAIRLHVHLSSVQASLTISLNGLDNFIRLQGNGTMNILSGCKVIQNLPSSGELFFHINQDAVWLWFDGVLLLDRKLDRSCVGGPVSLFPWQTFKMELKGEQTISDIITIQNPEISLEFFNAWGERTQVVQLESSDSALVSETIYDEMGRDAIKTKATRISRSENYSPLLIYYTDFVKNRYPSEASSVFKTGTVQGLASDLNPQDEGFPYSRTLYQDDMLREVSVEGMPGKTFSTFGTFTKKHGRHSGIPFLQILFPFERNFREKVTHEPNGTLRVSVLDKNQNEVAIYVKVAGYDNILTIFEYDDERKLVKMLPPKYHDYMRTHLRTKPWDFGEENLTEEEKYWQGVYGTHYRYDDNDQLVMKMAPDHKTKGFLYDTMGNMRFMYTLPNVTNFNATLSTLQEDNQVAEDIIYMLHIGQNKPIEIGYFNDPLNVGTLKTFQNGTDLPSVGNSQLHQRIVYSESHTDPDIRGKVRLFLTYDSADVETASGVRRDGSAAPPHQELLKFGSSNQVVMKTSNAVHTDTFTNYQKHYKGNKLKEMAYPRGRFSRSSAANETVFNLIHSYDKMGRLEGLGTRTDPRTFAQFGYNPAGQVDQEMLEPRTFSNSSRRFEYNSPGLLTRISDPFLTQSMSFVEGGYGQDGMGDGILMNNVMASTWSGISQLNDIQRKWFSISEEAFENDKQVKMCLQALKRVGILDEDTNIPLKFLTKSLLSLLPISCSGEMGLKLMNLVARHLPPTSNYGHSYSYGNHQELTKAKFFGDGEKESTIGPLRFVTFFEEIPEVGSLEKAEVIWDLLTRNQYLLVDNGNSEDKSASIGKEGMKGLFKFSKLAQDLKEVDGAFDVFSEPIMKMLYQNISEGGRIELGDFQNTFVNWHGYYDTPTANLIINRARESASKIYNMLGEKGWMSAELEGLLSEDYLEVLKNHENLISKITGCLTAHFSAQMGTNIYDFESYYIDPNGNRLMFYQGLNRYELEYEGASNRVKKLTVRDPYGGGEGAGDKVTEFEHDNHGNVNKAGHKNIQLIKYHPVTNRPVLIVLEDGRRILLKYDAQGERLLKRVFAPEGSNRLLSETKYLRDENGRVLMDKLTRFGGNGEIFEEFESTYLYGPRDTILGFYRNGKYYNVFTDHAGSTRLITHMGEVVAGYDYWPYGEMIRIFGESEAHLAYRFTGQEYDEETGLYNYHARLYDPTIGRFFQPDPKSQYYSPYVYGGNSPVSLVDPDGEFFLMLIFAVVGAIVGGYLAGAAANGNFNPLKWNWKSANTWLAILGGAVGGAMLPGSMAAAIGSIGLPATLLVGLGGSYLKMVKASGSWNPGDWDWSSPATYNAFLEGFGSAVQMVPGTKEALLNTRKYLKSMSKTGQKLFVEMASGASVALIKGAFENDGNFKFWEWDWSDPATWSSVKDGFMMGKGLPEKAGKAYKGFADMSKSTNWKSTLKNMKGTTKTFLKGVFKNKKHPLWKTLGKAVISYVATGMDQGTLDFTKWDWHSRSTYEGLMNNYKIAEDLKDMADQWRQGEWKEAFKDFFKKEVKQRLVEAFPQLGKIFDDMDKLGEFYGKYYVSDKGKMEWVENMMRNPVAMKMWLDLSEEIVAGMDDNDGGNFEKEMGDILGGLRAGSTIYPVVSEAIGNLIDCQSGKGEFEKCVIGGSSQGLVQRMNREFSKNVFKPSRLYQSKNEFVRVQKREKAEEYSEEILGSFGNGKMGEFFYGSFFIGSIFHSLLNVQNSSRKKAGITQPQLYFLQESLDDLENVLVTHIAMLVEKGNRKILHVRSLFALNAEIFTGLKDKLTENLKQTRFECYLPDTMTVDEVQAESIVISENDLGGSDVYVITPDYHVEQCEGQNIGKKFIEIPQPTGGTIYEDFSKYLDESIESLEEKERLYETLLKTLMNVSNQANMLLPTISPIPFIYGMIHSNLKQTYDLTLQVDKFSNSISFVPKRNSKGQQTWHGIPSTISLKSGHHHQFLHKSTALTLTKQALIGLLTDDTIVTSPVTLPKFNGLLDTIEADIDLLAIETSIRFIYYNSGISSSNLAFAPTSSHTNFHFVSNFILGEFLSQVEHSHLEIFVLAPAAPSSMDHQRLKAQRLFFLRNPEDKSSTILNIVESSMPTGSSNEYEFDPSVLTDVPSIPNVEISRLQVIQINLNPNSLAGWSQEEDGSLKPPEIYFWQGLKVTTEDHRFFSKDPAAYLKLEIPSMNETLAFSFSRDFITDMFSRLKENRLQLLINVDQDLQSVVMGILMGASTLVKPNIDGITTTLRNFDADEKPALTFDITSPTKLSILSVAKEGVVIPQTEQVLLANLKSITDTDKKNDVIEAKLKEAMDELKMYQCSRDEKLKQVFKVSSLPAVYDSSETANDPDSPRVYFEIDPEALSEMNCTAADNPFREFLGNRKSHQKDDCYEKEGYFDKIKTKFTQYVYGNHNMRNERKMSLDTHIEKCHLGAWSDGQYSMDGITCNSGKSRIAVFRNIEPNDLVRTSSRGDPFLLVGDNYKNEECTPINFNGRESVACKGEKSTLIYTPYFEPRLFDELDGNLMLGRVIMHMGGKLWSFVRDEHSVKATDDHVVTDEIVGLWESDIKDITAILGKWEGDRRELNWAKDNLEECREMIENLEQNGLSASPEVIEVITERLGAIKEDLSEEILFAKMGNMFEEKMEGTEKKFGDESRTTYYGGTLSTAFSHPGVGMGNRNSVLGSGQGR